RKEAQEEKRKQAQEEKAQAIAAVQGEALAFIHAQQDQFEKPFKKRLPDYSLDVNNIEEFQIFADKVQVEAHRQEDLSNALKDAIVKQLQQMNSEVKLASDLPEPRVESVTTPNVPTTNKPSKTVTPLDTSKPIQSEGEQPKPNSPTSLKNDQTALKIVQNILNNIDIKSRFKNADVNKKFGFASYKMFQNKKRGDQLKALDDAIKTARTEIMTNPNEAFRKIDEAIAEVKSDLHKEQNSGKRKLGESRLEKAVNNLSHEMDKLKTELGIEVTHAKPEPQKPPMQKKGHS
ncbi:MAG TPA: hypothetical protein PLD88_00140, partial [Candidatus Berkiella sp.]|nr:hypothetical protein [Candidatus Berkiella sp.]